MKALTLTQPWASLVALGEKRIETRSWGTSYRGELAIHAAASIPPAWSAEGVGWVPALERRFRSRRYLWLNRSSDGGTCLACGPPESANRTHSPMDHTYFAAGSRRGDLSAGRRGAH